jgi:hypothetical protein
VWVCNVHVHCVCDVSACVSVYTFYIYVNYSYNECFCVFAYLCTLAVEKLAGGGFHPQRSFLTGPCAAVHSML